MTFSSPWKRANTDWMRDAKFGVMLHYLADPSNAENSAADSVEEWNRRVDAFDVPALVGMLQQVHAGYLLFTVGQFSGYYCSPNATFDRIVGIQPSRCSHRDLVGEIAVALAPTGIRLIVYSMATGPMWHREATEALGFTPPWDASKWKSPPGSYHNRIGADDRLTQAQRNWEAVLTEWSSRWGRNVHGWWIDACYYPEKMYYFDDEPNFRSFARALKAGNSDSLVSFNPGVMVPTRVLSECDDYLAGETNVLITPCKYHEFKRFYDMMAPCELAYGSPDRLAAEQSRCGAQLHILTYLGDYWCRGTTPRYSDGLVVEYTRYINGLEGAVTWDVPIASTGVVPEIFVRQLAAIGAGVCSDIKDTPLQ
jgi:hypothetical protein